MLQFNETIVTFDFKGSQVLLSNQCRFSLVCLDYKYRTASSR